MVTVKFHGDLKRFTNDKIELEVTNFNELMSGLLTQIKGLRNHLRQGYYKVRVGNRYLTEEQIKASPIPLNNVTIHFTPVIAGAGKAGGIIQAVVGVALIAAAFWTGGASIAAWSTMQMTMGVVGASLVLSGAISLLTKMPDMNNKIQEGEKKQSTSFSNIKNITPQGRPIPLLYGKMMTSLVLISQGIETFDDMPQPQPETQPRKRRFR